MLKSYLQLLNDLKSTPYRLRLAKGEEKEFKFDVGYYLYLNKKEMELLPNAIVASKEDGLMDVGLTIKYSKFLNIKIKNRGFIYILIYDDILDLDSPDIEIPITF